MRWCMSGFYVAYFLCYDADHGFFLGRGLEGWGLRLVFILLGGGFPITVRVFKDAGFFCEIYDTDCTLF